ncbi:hypothetical protein [Thalassovita taeanensis]|nr:hypothetical protein [Thalassovita taeanensis]
MMGVQDRTAEEDAAAMGVALVVFWPAIFTIKGNEKSAAEVARLKGEIAAIEKASVAKSCDIKFTTIKPAEQKPAEQTEIVDPTLPVE